MSKIKIAIVGVGNCVSSLIQGIHYYREKKREDAIGLMHYDMNGYKPGDIEVVAAFDIDQRKVGRDVHEAIFTKPNCTTLFCSDLPPSGVTVRMGKIMDGVADHMKDYPDDRTFVLSDEPEPTAEGIIQVLKESGAHQLSAGRFRRRYPVICRLRVRGRDCFCQQHSGVHRQRCSVGQALCG